MNKLLLLAPVLLACVAHGALLRLDKTASGANAEPIPGVAEKPATPGDMSSNLSNSDFDKLARMEGWRVNEDAWNQFVDENGCPNGIDYICNTHNKEFICTCFHPYPFTEVAHPTCDERFDFWNVYAYIIQLRTKLPHYPRFLDVFDGFLADVISDFAQINKEHLVILRKDCIDGDFVVQFGFLKNEYNREAKISSEDMQVIHPNLFLKNKAFMGQHYLPIINITQVDYITPVTQKIKHRPSFSATRPGYVHHDPMPTVKMFTWFEIGMIVFVSGVLVVLNLIPIYILCRFLRERRTRDLSATAGSAMPQKMAT